MLLRCRPNLRQASGCVGSAETLGSLRQAPSQCARPFTAARHDHHIDLHHLRPVSVSPISSMPQQAAAALTNGHAGAHTEQDDVWEVVWCLDGWHSIADKLETMLPAWAVLKRVDPSRPLHEQVANACVLIPTTGVVDAQVIAAAPNLRLITQPAAGYNNIDVAAAAARGVPVCVAPGYNSHSTAEVALTMMLMLARRVDDARAQMRKGVIGEPAGWTLAGKTLGVVGMGRVGLSLARMAQALGMRVVSTDSKSSRADLESLLFSSDVVSLNMPLTPQTEGLIGAKELALMKRGALLINSARGSVIQKDALYEALVSGHLGGAGLDVHWVEPPPLDDPLYQLPNVLALPHLGCAEQQVYADLAKVLLENIGRVREGRELLHQIA